jgi:hypothetical protein
MRTPKRLVFPWRWRIRPTLVKTTREGKQETQMVTGDSPAGPSATNNVSAPALSLSSCARGALPDGRDVVAQWKDLKLPDGRDRVVRHGHGMVSPSSMRSTAGIVAWVGVPGLVVIIEHRGGSVQTIAPMPAPPIEVEPIRERAEQEPPGR